MATVADKANETHNVQKRAGGREVLVKVYPIKLRRRKMGGHGKKTYHSRCVTKSYNEKVSKISPNH